MEKVQVHEHPIPDRWVIGTLQEHGGVDVFIKRRGTGAYIVTLAGNVMDAGTGQFKNWQELVTADVYGSMYAAFEAFQKFYQ